MTQFNKTRMKVCLSARGLANIPVDESQNDFEFRVGTRYYRCRSVIADFLSHKISALHAIDSTIRSFEVKTVDAREQFCDFISLGQGCEILISEVDIEFFKSLSLELENFDLYEFVRSKEELNMKNAIASIKVHKSMDFDSSRECEFIAQHFYEMFSSSSVQEFDTILSELGYEEFHRILRSPSLRIMSEESLYELISSRFSSDLGYFGLFEFVRFEYLPVSVINKFINLSQEHYELMTSSIWDSICIRLSHAVSPERSNDRTGEDLSGRIFSYELTSPLNGIISYLTQMCGGNVHKKGLITVTANQPYLNDPSSLPNVLDLGTNSYYYSQNSPNQWICFDFKGMAIRPTHYSIQAYDDGSGGRNLRDWVVEGSDDGNGWRELDRRTNNSELNGANFIRTFSVSKPERCRLIRLRQTGKNHAGNDHLLFNSFELFGTLRE
jgi:hypothetical protein